jgi:hypothetical protein
MNAPTCIDKVIAANIAALYHRLDDAARIAASSSAAAIGDYHNLAIGRILPLEQILAESEALFRVILLLHRSRDREVQP